MTNSWWERASDEQRLAQIDAGIELGMTARQVSLASGTRVYRSGHSVVEMFASRRGRHFPINTEKARRRATKQWDTHNRRLSYLSGSATDLWSAPPPLPTTDEPVEVTFE